MKKILMLLLSFALIICSTCAAAPKSAVCENENITTNPNDSEEKVNSLISGWEDVIPMYIYPSDDIDINIKVIRNDSQLQTIYIADVVIKDVSFFKTCFANDTYCSPANVRDYTGKELGVDMANRNNAIFAINGCYNNGLTIHDGIIYAESNNNKGILCFHEDGSVKTFVRGKDNFDVSEELKNGMIHAWEFGPVLVQNWLPVDLSREDYDRHPRSVFGYYEPGHYVFLVCDGRSYHSRGMTTRELGLAMMDLGVKEAFNLDGGFSSVMIFNGETINNNTFNGEHSDGRPNNDLIYFSGEKEAIQFSILSLLIKLIPQIV